MRESHWSSSDLSPSVVHGPPSAVAYAQTVPSLPGMPAMLPEEPTETAVTAAALRAVAPTDHLNTDVVRAQGAVVRVILFGIVCMGTATVAWAVAYAFYGISVEAVLGFWLGALMCVVVYTLTTESTGRKYSAAGIEHAKIDAAVQIHADRLQARQEMHQQATEAWERVLVKYLEKF